MSKEKRVSKENSDQNSKQTRAERLIQIRIPVPLYARIVRQSQSSNRNMEDLYQDAVNALLESHKEPKGALVFRASYKGTKAYNLNVRLPEQLYDLADREARRSEVSKTSFVYTALYNFFQNKGR